MRPTKTKENAAVDIETNGLFPQPDSKIYCVTVNYRNKIALYEDPEEVRDLLEDPAIKKIIHNAAFDSFWFRRLHNIRVRNIGDTRLQEQIILGETLPRGARDEKMKKELSSSLLYTLPRYGLPVLENKEMGAAFATRPIDKPLTSKEKTYAKNDVRWLPKLYELQVKKLIALNQMPVADLENALVERLVEMRHRGIGFDEKVWLEIAERNKKSYDKILRELPKSVANWNSPQQVKNYFASKGIMIDSLTGIEEIAEGYNNSVLHKFIELRGLYKDVTTYGASWLEDDMKGKTVDKDGRIRSDFEQILNTGRLSSAHPNLQNLKREGLHRSALVAGKGKVLISPDFSKQELGIMAAASGEQRWIDAILKGEDVHAITASLIYEDAWNKAKKKGCAFPKQCDCKGHQPLRQNAKTINFAIAYGAGSGRIGQALKIKENDALRLLAKYKRAVPTLTRWLDNNGKDAIRTRLSFSADPFKRRRVLRDPEDWMLKNIGKNNPVQAAGANMIKLSMVNMPEDIALVLTVHDELVAECNNNKKEIARVSAVMKKVMEAAADYCTGVPGLIKVEPKVSLNLMKK